VEVAALRFRNSQYVAILRIPGEILVATLRHVIKTSPDYQEAVRLVTSICHYLRTLVFGTPELWGFVSMRNSLGPLFLQRCQGNPISVVPYFMEGDPVANTRIRICLNYWKSMPNLHLTRVELIEFCGIYEDFTAVSWIFNYYMPNLEVLTLSSGAMAMEVMLDPEEDTEVWDVNPATQRTLKDVYLQQIFVPWESNIFYGLSTLHLDYRGFIPGATSIPMDAFLEILSHSPRLEKCSLYFAVPQCRSKESLPDTSLRPTWTANFPLLEELTLFDETLNVAYLLRYLRFPTTTKVLLKVATPPDQLEDLLSTLLPPNSSHAIDGVPQIALRHKSHMEFRPVLEIGRITIQYLNEWGGLSIEPNDIMHTTFTLPLVEAVRRTGPSVHLLKIRLNCELAIPPAVWRDILEHLPNLEELTYTPGEGVDNQWPDFWNLFSQTGENGTICQHLRTLRIVDFQGVPPDTVGGLVERWKLGRPLDVFQLRVGNCERSVAQQIVACLHPFVGQLIFEVIEKNKVVSLMD